MGLALPPPEIDPWTRKGHERFKRSTSFVCGDGKIRTFEEWLEWQATREPLADMPARQVAGVRKRVDAEANRGNIRTVGGRPKAVLKEGQW